MRKTKDAMAVSNSAPLSSFTELFDATVASYRKNFKTIAGLSAITLVAWLPSGYFQPAPNNKFSLLTLVLSLFYVVVTVLITIAIYYLTDNKHSDKSISDLINLSWSKFAPVLWVVLLSSLVIAGGFLLLIIPGIIVAVWLVFAQQVAIFEDKRGVQALKQSRQYVRNRWWEVFSRFFVLIIITMLAGIVGSIVISIFTGFANPFVGKFLNAAVSALVMTPIATIFSYYLYRSAVKTHA
jgi:hypothetical protein